MSNRVTGYTDSNFAPMEGRKNGSQTVRARIWLGNIFPIPCDQSSQNKILGNKKVSGMLFMRRNRLENVLQTDLWSPF